MTTKPVAPQAETAGIIRFPDPSPEELTAFEHVNFPAYPPSLALHFGSPETTIITSEVAAGLRATVTYEGVLFPDLLIAFNVDPEARRARNGYLISEQGKPPDFVLEVASETTARRDETHKRGAYAAMGVPSTGASMVRVGGGTKRAWLRTVSWRGSMSPSRFTRPKRGTTGATVIPSNWICAGKRGT